MNDSFILPEFPLPPSVNDAYAEQIFLKKNARFPMTTPKTLYHYTYATRTLTAKAKAYKQQVSEIMNESGATTYLREFVEYHGTVDLWIYVYKDNWYTKTGEPRPNKNAGDCSNRIKVLEDAIFNCIGIDDCHVFFSGVRKMPGGEAPKAVVVVRKTPDVVDEF